MEKEPHATDSNVNNSNPDLYTSDDYAESRRRRRRNVRNGGIVAGVLAVLLGGYFLTKHLTSNKEEIIVPEKTKRETTITATRNIVDTVFVSKGSTAWGIVSKSYHLSDNDLIGDKVNEIAEYNYRNNPEQSKANLDNRAVENGKTVKKADGIKFDYLLTGSKVLLPSTREEKVTINYYRDNSGKLYDENLNPISYTDLKEIVRKKLKINNNVDGDKYEVDPKYDALIQNILTSFDEKHENLRSKKISVNESHLDDLMTYKNVESGQNLGAIINENISSDYKIERKDDVPNAWDTYMDGNYSYGKLKKSDNKNDLVGYLVDTYKNKTVKEATNILGISKYQLYKTLDAEFGKGVMRKSHLHKV